MSTTTDTQPTNDNDAELSEFGNDLLHRLKGFNSAPILFIGAGVSKRYLNLPSWDELLEELADKTDKAYSYYKSTADGNLPKTASLLTEPIKNFLWNGKNEKLLKKYENDLQKRDSALKVLIADKILSLRQTTDKTLVEELELLRSVVVDAIITTNYDLLIENNFPTYQAFVGQDELLFSNPKGVGELYLIHGSANKPNSIVITEEDFKDYADRNPYLAAKLLTLFAEHPVIFLGYSLSDPNVTQILESLVKCLTTEQIAKLQDRLFFVHWDKNAKPVAVNSAMKIQDASIPVINIEVPDYKELFIVLGKLRRKFSARMLRRLKDHVYELILTNDPKNQLFVAEFDEEDSSQPDVVFGVGAIHALGTYGYEPLTRIDLIKDILYETNKFDPENIITKTIPKIMHNGNFPYVKYALAAKFIDDNGNLLREKDMDPRLAEKIKEGDTPFLPTRGEQARAARLAKEAGTFKKMTETLDLSHTLMALPAIPYTDIPPEELRLYLIAHEKESIKDGVCNSHYAKAVCLYDRLKFLKHS